MKAGKVMEPVVKAVKVREPGAKKRTWRRILLGMAICVAVLAVLAAATFIPTLWLKTAGMRELRGNWVTVRYEAEESAARDVFALADQRAEQLAKRLGFTERQAIAVYIYDSQQTFQTKKYGLLAPLLKLDWYIGDNKGTNVLLTSPANPGRAHSYKDCRDAVLHEMVHAYNYILNPGMPLWLNEGAALYLSNGNPRKSLYRMMPTPTFADIQTRNPVRFSSMGGYDFACTYVEYLDRAYGWDKVLTLMRSGSYEGAIGVSAADAYAGWVEFLKLAYA